MVDKYHLGKRRLVDKRFLRQVNGLAKPETWKCACGRRFIGDDRLLKHLEKSRHGFASTVRKNWNA